MLSNTMSFLYMIEHTRMTKSYKGPVLLSLFQENTISGKIAIDVLMEYFKYFYAEPKHRLDLNDLIHENFDKWSNDQLESHILRNPISALLNTSSELFYFINREFGIKQEVYEDLIQDNALDLVKEKIHQRLAHYYSIKFKVVI